MLLGAAVVFGTLFWMNEHAGAAASLDERAPVAFEIAPPPPKKKEKPKPRAAKPPPKRAVSPRLAPTPSLSAAISGLSFDLPGFDAADLRGVGDELLGAGSVKNMVMTEETVDKKPVPRRQVAPEFPPSARQRGVQGYVKLNLFINAEGLVEKVRVLEAEPRGVFDEAAVTAAQQWEFEPAEYNGTAVTGWFKRTVSFRLN
jgi:protein TonB